MSVVDPRSAEALGRADPRGLIREAYRIEGITAVECRSIFFDWALGRADGEGDRDSILALIAHYQPRHPEHPMTEVLEEVARAPMSMPRRGRRRAVRREGED